MVNGPSGMMMAPWSAKRITKTERWMDYGSGIGPTGSKTGKALIKLV